MNRDDLIRRARSAIRLSADDASLMGLDRYEFLHWFAKEVAAAEREACAQIADAHASIEGIAQTIAAEIRSDK